MKEIRVAIFEDNRNLRQGLEQLINGSSGFTCVGAFANCNHLSESIEASHPDVVLMDIELNGAEDGIYAACKIRDQFGIPSVFMTGRTDLDTNERALLARPLAYLVKPVSLAHLTEALCRVSANDR